MRLHDGYHDHLPVHNNVLDYATPTAVPRFAWRAYLFLTCVGFAVTMVFWWRVDWYAYRLGPDGTRIPEFEFPLWVQVGVSVAVGAFTSAGVYTAALVLRRLARGARRSTAQAARPGGAGGPP